jgi:acetyl esterase/lipase
MKGKPSHVVGRSGVLALLLTVAMAGCRVSDLPVWAPKTPETNVEKISDVTYYDGPGTGGYHRLDVYLPRGQTGFPVVVLVHGGAWIGGDNRWFGLYSAIGEFLAGQGIAAVLPNYRLSPAVKHPEHVTDVARAVAWTRAHIAEHGGCPEQIFLAGHSAGAHLVSLLTTDEHYLRAQGMCTQDIKGVIAVSGVYRIAPGKADHLLGGDLRLDQVLPMRGDSPAPPSGPVDGVPVSLNVYGRPFGEDPIARANASPINHVRPGLPPFLVVCADNELPSLCENAEAFFGALRQQGCSATFLKVEYRNHNSVMFRAIDTQDPLAQAILDFIRLLAGRATCCGWVATPN